MIVKLVILLLGAPVLFESSVNSYDSQTVDNADQATISLRVV